MFHPSPSSTLIKSIHFFKVMREGYLVKTKVGYNSIYFGQLGNMDKQSTIYLVLISSIERGDGSR